MSKGNITDTARQASPHCPGNTVPIAKATQFLIE